MDPYVSRPAHLRKSEKDFEKNENLIYFSINFVNSALDAKLNRLLINITKRYIRIFLIRKKERQNKKGYKIVPR